MRHCSVNGNCFKNAQVAKKCTCLWEIEDCIIQDTGHSSRNKMKLELNFFERFFDKYLKLRTESTNGNHYRIRLFLKDHRK